MNTATAFSMNDTKRCMWMQFLVQCSFLWKQWQTGPLDDLKSRRGCETTQNLLNDAFPLMKDLEWAVYMTGPANHLIKCVFLAPKRACRDKYGGDIHQESQWLNLRAQKHSQRECVFELRRVVIVSSYCTWLLPHNVLLHCTVLSSYLNVKLSVSVSYLIWQWSFRATYIFSGRRRKKRRKALDLTFSAEVNKNKSGVCGRENVTNVNVLLRVLLNKCLPAELMVRGANCVSPSGESSRTDGARWYTTSASCLNAASTAEHKQQTLCTSCVSTPESKPLAFHKAEE